MPARNPEEICTLFKQYMAEGNIDALRDIYDPEIVFVNRAGEVRKGWEGLKHELLPFANARAAFEYRNKGIVQSGDIALMHTEWTVSGPQPMTLYATEVARRQPDRTWRWLIGDPFTVGRHMSEQPVAA